MDVNEGELETLIALIRMVKEPRRVLEIGVNVGRTAKAIMANVPGIKHYIGVDVPLSYKPILALQNNNAVPNPGEMVLDDPRFQLIIRPRGSLDLTPEELPPCDVVFIDGDHGWAAVEHDSQLARRVVRGGGIIIWHDYHDIGNVDVKAVLDEFNERTKAKFNLGDILYHVENTWLAFQH